MNLEENFNTIGLVVFVLVVIAIAVIAKKVSNKKAKPPEQKLPGGGDGKDNEPPYQQL